MSINRYALHRTTITDVIEATRRREIFERFMPSNYTAHTVRMPDGTYGIVIQGRDVAGWGLDTYCLPRLASGLYFAGEIGANEARAIEMLQVESFLD